MNHRFSNAFGDENFLELKRCLRKAYENKVKYFVDLMKV